MNDADPDDATSHIPRRSPPVASNPTNTSHETPWWQTIYQRPPTSFHDTPAARQPQRPPPDQRIDARPLRPRAVPPRANRYIAAAPPSAPRQAPQSTPPPRPRPTQPGPGPTQRSPRRRRLIIIGCIVLAVEVVVLAVGLVLLRMFKTTELDVVQAQEGVAQILLDPIDGYGATEVTDVRCNNGANPVIIKDHTFSCSVNIEGDRRHVTVIFVDGAGTYEVQAPED
jgi:Domain of unknown function (DUF4333)